MRSGHDYIEAGNRSIVLVWFNDNNTQKQTYKLKKNEYILHSSLEVVSAVSMIHRAKTATFLGSMPR